jgi:sulfide:quinone oxidoreductase
MPNAKNITLDLSSLLPKFGINFINENTETIEPENNKVIIESKKEIYYDYLVILTGPKLNFHEEGQKESAYSVCTLEHTQELNKKLNEFSIEFYNDFSI